MRYLLDTHVLIWWLTDDRRLSKMARQAITDPRAEIFLSAASALEISIKQSLGKLEAPDDLLDQVRTHRFRFLDITFEHGLAAGRLPRHHNDPFDRVLVAQARLEGLVLITGDSMMDRYEVKTLKT